MPTSQPSLSLFFLSFPQGIRFSPAQPQLWVPYPFAHFAKGWGIEQRSTALLNTSKKRGAPCPDSRTWEP